jgi:hypothetical protein
MLSRSPHLLVNHGLQDGMSIARCVCPEQWLLWAVYECKWSREQACKVFDTFRDHWKAQPCSKGIKADWEATWRNWCRRETTFKKEAPLGKGEIRVRETSPAEAAQAKATAEFMRLAKLPENLRKSEAEIWEMVNEAGR